MRPGLLLDVCCGPDAAGALERFGRDYDVVMLFSGSNIHPREEYLLRLEQVRKVSKHYGVPLHLSPYEPEKWFRFIRGLENEPEGGRRCVRCFEFRLRRAASAALALGLGHISTTLTISPHKDVEAVNRLGREIASQVGLVWVEAVLRKKGGFQRSIEISRELGLYRQNYCGCRFSKGEGGLSKF